MKKIGLYNKVLVILIFGFFISLSGSTSFGLSLNNNYLQDSLELKNIFLSGDVIIVDDVPGWGSGNPPEDYIKIQDAIDASDNYDIIFVFGGTYNENLVIDRTIYLVGENRDKTVVIGGSAGDVVYISVDEVNVNGFTIKNSGYGQPDNNQTGLKIDANSSTITNNLICDNYIGLSFKHSNKNIVSNNNIENNEYGASLCLSNNNTISGNTISNNYLGININNATSNNITRNVLSNNDYGLYLSYCNGNVISVNNFIKNTKRNALFRGLCINQWIGNYWSRFRLLPKPILGGMGTLGLIPWINFDWSPARTPNVI